jgi:hypothetical protein
MFPKQLFIVGCLLCAFASAIAQTGSEILLFDLKIKKGKIILLNPSNITNHPGYDNQPYFHPGESIIYYSSFDEDGRSEIRSYHIKAKVTVDITDTPEREYSPTLTPDRKYLSCIIQRDDGAQDLGKYPVEGGEPYVIINSLKVGYHVWGDDSHIAMFILDGEDKNSLHYMRLPTKEDTVIATNIGRSLHKIPGQRAISFIQVGETGSQVMRFDTETMKVNVITPTVSNGDHVAWTPGGLLLTSDGADLFYFNPSHPSGGWKKATVESGADLLKGVTRLAVNADGNRIAIVISE